MIEKMIQKLIPALFALAFVVFFLLLVGPSLAQAQEVAVPATEVEPVAVEAANLYLVEDVVVIGVLFIILALLTLLGASIAALWRSAPGWMGDLVKPLVDGLLKAGYDYTTKTINPIDNEIYKAIESVVRDLFTEEFAALKEQINKPPLSIFEADSAIYGSPNNSGHRDDDNDLPDPVLADPVPTGG